MEFDEIGARCALHSCGRHDFLPYKCEECARMFCHEHRSPRAHACMREVAVSPAPWKAAASPAAMPKYRRCDMDECDRREPVAVQCAACGGSFCMAHRNQLDHNCEAKHVVRGASLSAALASNAAAAKKRAEEHTTSDLDKTRKHSTSDTRGDVKVAIATCTAVLNSRSAPETHGVKVDDELRWVLLVYYPLASAVQARYIAVNRRFTVARALDTFSACGGEKTLNALRSVTDGENGRFHLHVVRESGSIYALPHLAVLCDLGDHVIRDGDRVVMELSSPLSPAWVEYFNPPLRNLPAPKPRPAELSSAERGRHPRSRKPRVRLTNTAASGETADSTNARKLSSLCRVS
uniref:AN1-type domain-containing protein n=1 Tax=Erythrolobus australicus TaxID=1077150 RepID=A0A7S1TN64_9RHOD|mmetsp:Transcript_4939/g.13285  ORF Transcript_4939/g.13285 Transcript_4939/m.13285 type:complete len:349 (+) Transcript_4939:99-1145(+)